MLKTKKERRESYSSSLCLYCKWSYSCSVRLSSQYDIVKCQDFTQKIREVFPSQKNVSLHIISL